MGDWAEAATADAPVKRRGRELPQFHLFISQTDIE